MSVRAPAAGNLRFGSDGFFYGGQAVIEGVMMRGRRQIAVAVRRADGRVIVQQEPLHSWAHRFPFLRWPLFRGMLALVEALVIGVRALNFSASQYALSQEDLAREAAQGGADSKEAGAAGSASAAPKAQGLGLAELALTTVVAGALTVGLFIVLPAALIRLVQPHIGSNLVLNLVEGLIKVSLFILYIAAISLMPDIRRVFQYHGAEHKTINCYEAGEPLTVEHVRRHSLLHPRCGTNFILLVLVVGVFLFSFFGRPPFVQRVLIHLALLPLVAGVSYEIIRAAAKPKAPLLVRAIALPGLYLQKLTTRQPDDRQLEVAIQALAAVLESATEGRLASLEAGRAARAARAAGAAGTRGESRGEVPVP